MAVRLQAIEAYLNVAAMPPEVRAMLKRAVRVEQEKKDAIVAGLVANESCRFSKVTLEGKDLSELESIASLANLRINLEGPGSLRLHDMPPVFDLPSQGVNP